jgi:hypothetical protein
MAVLASVAVGVFLLHSIWSARTQLEGFGPAPSGTLPRIVLWLVIWALFYAFIAWVSLIALGVVLAALYLLGELNLLPDGKPVSWGLWQEIRDAWMASCFIAAPAVFLLFYLLEAREL